METKAPDENPYSTVKIRIGILPLDGSQSASTMIEEKPVVAIMTLYLPNLSPIMPGKIRPKML